MLTLLFIFSSSTATTITKEGFVLRHIKTNDTVSLSLLNTNLQAYIFWSTYANSPVTVIQNNGTMYTKHNISTASNGLRFSNITMKLKFYYPLTLYIWVIPKDTCADGASIYKTSGRIKDTAKFHENYKSFCLFFVDEFNQANIKASISSPDNQATIQLHTRHSLKSNEIDTSCNGNTCDADKYKPFFAEVRDIVKDSKLELNYHLFTNYNKSQICNRFDFSYMTEKGTTELYKMSSDSDFKCSAVYFNDITWFISAGLVLIVVSIIILLVVRKFISCAPKKDQEPNFRSPLNEEEEDYPQSEYAKKIERDVSKGELPEEKQFRIRYQNGGAF